MLHTIPIITNADIQDTQNVLLLQLKPQETYIQQACRVIFEQIKIAKRNKFDMDFMQIDNGGLQTIGGKMRKFAEGTIKGASDVQLWFSCKKTGKVVMCLCEFKRIGTRSQIKITPEQEAFQGRWRDVYKCDGFITNNPLYFEWRVLNILSILNLSA